MYKAHAGMFGHNNHGIPDSRYYFRVGQRGRAARAVELGVVVVVVAVAVVVVVVVVVAARRPVVGPGRGPPRAPPASFVKASSTGLPGGRQ